MASAGEDDLVLYTAGNSICTQKVFITFEEKGMSFSERVLNLFANEQYDPEYLKLNPKGVVPTLLLPDRRVVVESTLICEFVDETWGSRGAEPLVPEDPFLKAKMREWSKLVDEAIFVATRELSFVTMFRTKMQAMTEDQRQLRFANVGDPARRERYVSTYELGIDSPFALQSVGAWEKAFKLMEMALSVDAGQGGPWLVGKQYTLADINMTPYVWRLEFLNLLDLFVADKPLVVAWWVLAKARPAAVAAIPGRLDSAAIDNMRTHGTAMRDAVAGKRTEYLVSVPK